jgi:hypothetical protein
VKAEPKEQQQSAPSAGRSEMAHESAPNNNGAEDQRWLDSLEFILEYVLKNQGTEQAPLVLSKLSKRLREAGIKLPSTISTPYVNTIPHEDEPAYPGNRELERRIKSLVRWNAMAMVVTPTASTLASAAISRRTPRAPRFTRSVSIIFFMAVTGGARLISFISKGTRRRAITRARSWSDGLMNTICSISVRNWQTAAGFRPTRIRI